MRFVKIAALLLLIVLVGIQLIPSNYNQSETVPETDFLLVNEMPGSIKEKLQVSCYDCHSNNTVYPWYSRLQPAGWFLEKHIEDGKAELNFSEWNDYSSRRKYSKLRSIISQIRDDEMPLASYILLHADAKFSEDEKDEIIAYMEQLKDDL